MEQNNEAYHGNSRPEYLAILANHIMVKNVNYHEVYLAVTGQMFESLQLSSGVTLCREVTDGASGNLIEISYSITSGGLTEYETLVTTPEGKVEYRKTLDGNGDIIEGPPTFYRRAKLIGQLLIGRPVNVLSNFNDTGIKESD